MFNIEEELVARMDSFVEQEYVTGEYAYNGFDAGCMDCSNSCAENCAKKCKKNTK